MIQKLLLLLIYLSFGVGAASAAVLKDIRIGERENSTRIVFELDASVAAVLAAPPDSEHIRVDFPNTRPDLIKKIAVDQTRRIQEIQIWNNAGLLSTVIKLGAPQHRVESFTLKNPNRFAVDIYWEKRLGQKEEAIAAPLTSGHSDAMTSMPVEPQKVPSEIAAPIQVQEPSTTSPVSHQPPDETAVLPTTENTPAANATDTGPAKVAPLASTNVTAPPSAKNMANSAATSETGSDSPQRSNWLQYYLVITLIAITITILILLILMLLAHYRGIGERIPTSSKDFLLKQNSRIAELDERIKEQLKRYDEA